MMQYFNLSNKWTDYDENSKDVTGNKWFIGGSRDVITSPTAYAVAQGAYTSSSYHDAEGKESCTWLLRSPGYTNYYAAHVRNEGVVSALGGGVCENYGILYAVRPALWVNLAS